VREYILRSSAPLTIPFTIGVTGHRSIADNCIAAVERAIDSIFLKVKANAPATPLLILTSLAEGADRLVANIALERYGAAIVVVLPRAAASYREDFVSEESKIEFDRLLGLAQLVVTVSDEGKVNSSAEPEESKGYSSAGYWIAIRSHVLIALWDGLGTRGPGGTEEIVRAKLKGRYPDQNADEPLRYDEGGAVAHVVTARQQETPPPNIGQVKWLYSEVAHIGAHSGEHRLYAVLSSVNRMNRLLVKDGRSLEGWDARRLASGAVSHVAALKSFAEHYAALYQKRMHALALFIVMAAIIAGIASGVEGVIGDVITIAALGSAGGLWAFEAIQQWHRLHCDLRTLAEGCRVQLVWAACGVRECVADNYHPVQATSVAWIRRAIRTVCFLDEIQPTREVQTSESHKRQVDAGLAWVEEQVAYFLGDHGVIRRYRRHARQFAFLGFSCLGLGILMMLMMGSAKTLDFFGFHQTLVADSLVMEIGTVGKIVLAIGASLQAYQTLMAYGDLQRSFAVSAHLFSLAAGEVRLAAKSNDYDRLLHVIVQLGRAALVENLSWLLLRRQRRLRPAMSSS